MTKLSILLFFIALGLIGCKNPAVTVVCDGIPPTQAEFLGADQAGFYLVKMDQTLFRLPVDKCVIIDKGE